MDDIKSLSDLFKRCVQDVPKNIAVSYRGCSLTYSELNRQANQFSNYLSRYVNTTDDFVGIVLDRSLEMLMVMLACHKLGVGYVPIDPSYPKARIDFMISDSQLKVVVIYQNLLDQWPEFSAKYSNIKKIILPNMLRLIANEPYVFKAQGNLANVAYVLYTSGSTGQPKGVIIEQRALVNFFRSMQAILSLTPTDSLLAITPISFDISILELFLPLITGGKVVIADKETASDGYKIQKMLLEYQITIMQATPMTWQLLLDAGWQHDGKMKVLSGGEAMLNKLAARLLSEGYGFWNMYGPTETTIWSSCEYVTSLDQELQSVPIGRPIHNTQFFLINDAGEIASKEGELCIAGVGLARGYINRADLTAERFIFLTNKKEKIRVYRTGDLVRVLSDGRYYFVERLDTQIKLRGYRIELNEINAYLQRYDEVLQSVVVPFKDENNITYLVGYIVAKDNLHLDVSVLTHYLKKYLPSYMLPAAYVFLDKLPLTPNNKVDKKLLEELNPEHKFYKAQYFPPVTQIQNKLVSMLEEILPTYYGAIGIKDSFFVLGGNSLLGARLINRINDVWEMSLTLQDLFKYPTIEDLSELFNQKHSNKQISIVRTHQKLAATRKYFPLSSGQQRIFYDCILQDNLPIYHVPLFYYVKGGLQIEVLQKTFCLLLERHPILRTRLVKRHGEIMQVILRNKNIEFKIQAHHVEALSDQVKQNLIQEQFQKPFDLFNDCLVRAHLISKSKSESYLLVIFHHLIIDSWSEDIFEREIWLLYKSFAKGENDVDSLLQDTQFSYLSFIDWMRLREQEYTYEREIEYWRARLRGMMPLALPYASSVSKQQTVISSARFGFSINRIDQERLNQFAKRNQLTVFTTLLSIFYGLLWRYTNQNDITIGIPVSGRDKIEFENTIGFFVNTLIFRCNIQACESFLELAQAVNKLAAEAYAYQELPFDYLIKFLKEDGLMIGNLLINVMFVFESQRSLDLGEIGINLQRRVLAPSYTLFDLVFLVTETEKGLFCCFDFNEDAFDHKIIQRMADSFLLLLEQGMRVPDQAFRHYKFILDSEGSSSSFCRNEERLALSSHQDLIEIFQHTAENFSKKTAVKDGDNVISYRQLHSFVDVLASELLAIGVVPGMKIPIYMDRSVELIVSILAVLKCGCCYVPLMPEWPASRLNFILEEINAHYLLLKIKPKENIFNDIRCVEVRLKDEPRTQKIKKVRSSMGLDVPACLLFTSGSTGDPKGVLISHRNILRLAKNRRGISFRKTDCIFHMTNVSFDVSLFEIWGALLNGASLAIITREELLDIAFFKAARIKHQCNVAFFTTAVFNQFIRIDPLLFEPFRLAVFGGEEADIEVVQEIALHKMNGEFKNTTFVNAYGPTENTGCSTCFVVQAPFDYKHGVPIGAPITNSSCFVLDENLCDVPIGVPGDLYVGGDGVSLGYYKRESLTQEKFIVLPNKERVYKTGDVVKVMEDGNLMFLGRRDNQIKFRGYRIELGEIEHALRSLHFVMDAVVLFDRDKDLSRLLSAVVLENGVCKEENVIQEIRGDLRKLLPEYMIPSEIVVFNVLPLNDNQKIDRKKLLFMLKERANLKDDEAYTKPPRDRVEASWLSVWQQVLGQSNLTVIDDFFESGGYSILAIKLVQELSEKMKANITLRDLLEHPSVESLYTYFKSCAKKEKSYKAQVGPPSPIVELNAAKKSEKNLFFIHPVGGTVFWFYALSKYIKNFSVYGLQDPGIEGRSFYFNSFFDMADYYLEEIKKVQPEGPYFLAGSSFGANMSVEIAQQLRKNNESVAFVGLLDGWAFYPENVLNKQIFQKNMQRQSRILQQSFNDFNIPQDDFLLELQSQRARLLLDHSFSGIQVPLSLFKADQILEMLEEIDAPDNHWGKLAKALEIYNVPGCHETMLLDPHVVFLAEKFQQALDKAASDFVGNS